MAATHVCAYFLMSFLLFTAGLLQEEIQGILKGVKDGRVQQPAVLQATASVRSRKATGRRINGHTAGGDSRTDTSTLRHPLFPTRIKYCKCFPCPCLYAGMSTKKVPLDNRIKPSKTKKKAPLCSTSFCSNASS